MIGSWLLVGNNGAGTVTANSPVLYYRIPYHQCARGYFLSCAGVCGSHLFVLFNNTSPSIYGTEVETTAFEPTGSGGTIQTGNGNIWVADQGGNRMEEFSATGTYEGQIGCSGTSACSGGNGNGQFEVPYDSAIDASGNLWVVDCGGVNDRVEEFSATGTYEGQLGCSSGACLTTSTNGGFYTPAVVAVDASGNVWVTDETNNRVERNFPRVALVMFTNPSLAAPRAPVPRLPRTGILTYPKNIAIDASGNISGSG